MKLAVIFIGTSKYLNFLPTWYEGCEKYLAPNTEKQYFVFTDGEIDGMPENVNAFSQEHLPWPQITLYRWDTILKAKEALSNFEYVLFLDADMRVVAEVSEEELMTDKKYIGVHHPCHFLGMSPHDKYPGAFETDTKSCASIDPDDDISTYWQGCLWGGRTPYVIDMVDELDKRTKSDWDRNVIAKWHDESQMNKFFIENKEDVHTMGPQYAYPECFEGFCEFERVIVHLAKDNSKYQV